MDPRRESLVEACFRKAQDLPSAEREAFVRSELAKSPHLIADVMSLSPRTVGTHLYNIKQKLGASNSAELAIIAIRAGLIEP